MTMLANFTLTLTLTGQSLDDIDNALIAAAGERLKARMVKPFQMPNIATSAPPPAVETVLRATADPVNLGPKKRGRPAGAKNKEDKNVETHSNDEPGNLSDAQSVDASPERAPEAPQAAPQTPQENARAFSQEEVVQALKSVNSKFNVDKARECLAHFSVKRCGDLTEEQRGQFVRHCEALCGY